MERYKKRPKDKDVNDALEHIYNNAFGNIIVAEDTPTNSTMKANTGAFYSNEIYFKLANGRTYKFTVTEVS